MLRGLCDEDSSDHGPVSDSNNESLEQNLISTDIKQTDPHLSRFIILVLHIKTQVILGYLIKEKWGKKDFNPTDKKNVFIQYVTLGFKGICNPSKDIYFLFLVGVNCLIDIQMSY